MTQELLEAWLSYNFEEAKPVHGLLNVGWLSYGGSWDGKHSAIFADESDKYRALFDEHLQLWNIRDEDDNIVYQRTAGTDLSGIEILTPIGPPPSV